MPGREYQDQQRGQLPAEQVQGHATRVPHRRSGPVALCEEEPDHLGGSIGAPRVGVGPDRVPSVPGVSAAMHRPRLSEDDAVEVGVHGAGAGVAGGLLVEIGGV